MRKIEHVADERLAIRVRLQPRASRDEIVGWDETGRLQVRVTAPPVDEGANRELIKLLAKFLHVPRTELIITSGVHSRTKRITAPRSCENRLLSLPDI
ncbi:MAG: DUF167 domain-containing protein [Candidatus Krumholzibacteriia bacterium]